MPLYDYECRNCGHRVEVLHGVNDPGPQACEVCGGQMRKLLTSPAIVFKGSGWAKKDARDSAKPASQPAAKSSGDGDGAKPSTPSTNAEPASPPSTKKETSTGAAAD
jgi:putative FmdB family regulatory protein